MRAVICGFALAALLCGEAAAACTPEMLASLRARGASPALIARICGSYSPASGSAPQSTICKTDLGVCVHSGPANEACTCPSPTGKTSGVSR
jgi:hypothetical protein